MKKPILLLVCGLFVLSMGAARQPADAKPKPSEEELMSLEKAIFAGGCFWCVEAALEKLPGVAEVVSGFTGGHTENPTYEDSNTGKTGHTEAVQVFYDPGKISYEELLDTFWRQIDPTDAGGQFADRGSQYRPGIFYLNDAQKEAAEASKKILEESGVFDKPIVTEITKATAFYNAEDYHQDYYKKNPLRYKFYRAGSGRDQFLKQTWKNHEKKESPKMSQSTKYPAMSKEELKKRLTPLQYKVTQEDGTERAFQNEFWDSKSEGIYVDLASGEPLFSSRDKYDSGTGWPSFTKPLEEDHIVEKVDRKLLSVRTEVRSKHGDSHLGHLFDDGPAPTGHRYCINSAALRFIPKEDLEAEGYGEYAQLFAS